MSNKRYMMRGVSAAKEDVHNAIKNIDKGIFPQAFCKIIPDILGGDPEYCNIMHADGAGTKSSLAYAYWKETGDLNVWKGIAQDALIMNTDDLLCVGAVDNILVSSTIGRNKMLIPGEVISAIINGTDQLMEEMQPIFKYGIIKERMAALMTDALRANLLEQAGYETQILEFIELEDTPKNLLIRAVLGTENGDMEAVNRLVQAFSLRPAILELME